MMRISATMLDSFRLYKSAEFISTEEMDARLRRDPIEPNEAMLVGTAFHGIAEGRATPKGDPQAPEGAAYECDGYLFDAETTDRALAMCRGFAEIKSDLVRIDTRYGSVALVGKCDSLHGREAIEIKTKIGRDLDPTAHISAWQWRVYCRVFGVDRVRYLLARLDLRDGVYHVKHDMMDVYPYPGLALDVEREVRELTDYAATRGLLDYLHQSNEQQEAA